MNNTCCLRTCITKSMHMGHNIMAQFAFILLHVFFALDLNADVGQLIVPLLNSCFVTIDSLITRSQAFICMLCITGEGVKFFSIVTDGIANRFRRNIIQFFHQMFICIVSFAQLSATNAATSLQKLKDCRSSKVSNTFVIDLDCC